MQAIILAAGMGKRLKELTRDVTKCMVRVNGRTLIERALSQLDALRLSRVVIVVGYQGRRLEEYIKTLGVSTPIVYIENPIYDKTNNIYSLYLAKEYLLEEDTLLLESDLIFEEKALHQLLDNPYPNLALVARYESWMDGTVVKMAKDGTILDILDKKHFQFSECDSYCKTVNIYKFSREFSQTHYVPFLEAYCKALGDNQYYEQVLKVIALLDVPDIKALRLEHCKWYEIDDIQDLDIAETMFASSGEEKLSLMEMRYGGYWRYPGVLDFCYLVNPYFPPQKLIDEMQASFPLLLRSYPSGQDVNRLLGAMNFSLRKEQIVVGNGASELIKSLMGHLRGPIGVLHPSFAEYGNRYATTEQVPFVPQNEDFSYTADDLIAFYQNTSIVSLLLVNPDNPSGNCIGRDGIVRLLSWAEEKGVRLVVDESFIDFSDPWFTLLDSVFLDSHPSLVVVKSISKSYGVPGIRLGVLASGDHELIARMAKDVAIWDINAVGEFFLQIENKYHDRYLESLATVKKERARFYSLLTNIAWLRPIPSQANYIMCEVKGNRTSRGLAIQLLEKDDILIKDLSRKTGIDGKQYIRLAIRDETDDDRLLVALMRC
jgi:histidinol-phosphate/aromatic aminotransferase/cobyric acid decarboxylase-like protein/choline kinase